MTMEIKDVLAELMRRADINQPDLAAQSGVPQPTINKILSGTSKHPTVGNVSKLAGFFGVTMEQMFGADPLLETGDSTGKPIMPRPSFVRQVPIIGQSALMDEGAIWSRMEVSIEAKNPYIQWISRDTKVYALRCTGDSMMPRLRPGEYIIVEPSTEYGPGSEVLIKGIDGRVMLKQFLYQQESGITVYSINENQAPVRIPMTEIEQIDYVAGIAKPSLLARN